MTTTEYLANLARETELTRAGHWHPEAIECSVRCPIGDPRTAALFRREIDRAYTTLQLDLRRQQ